MESPPGCPPAALLERLLLGRVPAREAGDLETHLETCPVCEQLVPALPAEDEIVRAMRSARAPLLAPDDAAVVETLVRWLRRGKIASTDPGQTASYPGDTRSYSSEPDLSPAGTAPETLGRFRLLRKLGAGGMGVVYLAFDPRLERQVALKVIHLRKAQDPAAVQRFLQEARSLAAVESDHIVVVHDVGEEDGVCYLTMPVLKGETLDARLRRAGPLPLAEVLRIGRETAAGLAAAHARGLIHRDIKPGNLWLEGPGDRVKILDFGLACMIQDLDSRSLPSGTPPYMAPEQAMGQAVDPRADLFSLGCVLYLMAVGSPPFTGTDVLATLLQVATVDPVPPRQANPHIPPALEALIRRLLAKKPDDRPASAEEVVKQLRAIETEAAERRRRRSRRRWLIGTALSLVAACGLTAILTWSSPSPAVVKGQVTVEMEPGGWSAVVQRGQEEWPLDRKGDHRLTLPAGDYQVRLAEPQGGLRPWPGSFTVTAGEEATVNLQLVGEEARYAGSPGPVLALALSSRDTTTLSGGGGDLRIALWDPSRQKKPDRFLEGSEADVRCLAMSPDGKRAVSGEGGKQKQKEFAVWLWDLTGATGRTVARGDQWVTALAWLPDGKQVLFGDSAGRLVLLDLETNQKMPLVGHQGRLRGVCVSADGTRAVSAADDKQLIVWDLKEHKPLGKPFPLPAGVRSVALTADGWTAVTAGEEGNLLVWNLGKGEAAKLPGHEGPVNSVALSADGSRLVSGGDDKTVRLWDMALGKEIYREQHDGKVQAVALSADGKHALSGGLDRTVRFWRLPQSPSGRK